METNGTKMLAKRILRMVVDKPVKQAQKPTGLTAFQVAFGFYQSYKYLKEVA